MLKNIILFLLLLTNGIMMAQIKTKTVEYKDGETVLEGMIAYREDIKQNLPVVIIVHDWMGVGEYTEMRARKLAEFGYLAFAADIYGKGIRPKNSDEAAQLAGSYKKNVGLLRSRINAALTEAKANPLADTSRVAAIGYCFGGTTVLELARSGANLNGVISFHGGLSTPDPNDAKNIRTKILVLHGADDPYVNDEEVTAFEKEMRNAGVDWQLIKYSGAVHSFTNPASGNDPSKGAAYSEKADKRSWQAMLQFFREVFRRQGTLLPPDKSIPLPPSRED